MAAFTASMRRALLDRGYEDRRGKYVLDRDSPAAPSEAASPSGAVTPPALPVLVHDERAQHTGHHHSIGVLYARPGVRPRGLGDPWYVLQLHQGDLAGRPWGDSPFYDLSRAEERTALEADFHRVLLPVLDDCTTGWELLTALTTRALGVAVRPSADASRILAAFGMITDGAFPDPAERAAAVDLAQRFAREAAGAERATWDGVAFARTLVPELEVALQGQPAPSRWRNPWRGRRM